MNTFKAVRTSCFALFGHGKDGKCLARNSIAQVATVYFAQVKIVLVTNLHLMKETVQNLIRIASSQVDVATRRVHLSILLLLP